MRNEASPESVRHPSPLFAWLLSLRVLQLWDPLPKNPIYPNSLSCCPQFATCFVTSGIILGQIMGL